MMNTKDRVVNLLNQMSIADIKAAYILTLLARRQEKIAAYAHLLSSGYREVPSDEHDGYLTSDGKEVYKFIDRYYILTDEEQAIRKAILDQQAEDRATGRETSGDTMDGNTKVISETEDITEYKCPKCSEYMVSSSLCTKCNAYRIGYTHKFLCTCGVSFITKLGVE